MTDTVKTFSQQRVTIFGVESNEYEQIDLFPIDHGYVGVLNNGARGAPDSAEKFLLGTSGRNLG